MRKKDSSCHTTGMEFDINAAEWYYQNQEGETEGPCLLATLQTLYTSQDITTDSNVWCEEIDSWDEIGNITCLANAFV